MNLLTELLLAILISALLAVNTVVQTNQTTNETAAIAVGAYLNSVAIAVARFSQANSGAAPTAFTQLSTAGGLGLRNTIPAGNNSPIFGIANLAPTPSTFASTIAYACTPGPLTIRQINSDANGRDALVNVAILSMGGSGARTYPAEPARVFGAFGSINITAAVLPLGTTLTQGNGILCAWKNIYNSDLLKSTVTATSGTCSPVNKYQIVFSFSANKPAYCDGVWKAFDGTALTP